MQTVVSVDIGTTAVKTSLIERTGRILLTESIEYPLITNGSQVEQNPRDWWTAFCKSCRRIVHSEEIPGLEAVVLSGQMQDLILLNHGTSVGNAILYSDTRSKREFSELSNTLGTDFLEQITRNPADAAGLPAKIRMIQSHQNLSDPACCILLGAHDYLCWRLTGEQVTDPTNASTTGLLNFSSGTWDRRILSYLGITEDQLPRIEQAGTVSGVVSAHAAEACGLPYGLPVIHGAGDAGSSTIGAGAGVPGVVSCYLGTSGWIAMTVNETVNPSTGIHNLKHPNGQDVIAIGPMLMAGGNISWVLDLFDLRNRGGDPFQILQETAREASAGSSGLFYLPYLQGERSPFRDPNARGAFIGLRKHMGRPEMFRAVIEGIAYSLTTILTLIEGSDLSRDRYIHVSGGGAENIFLTEILASITGATTLVSSNAAQSGALGNTVIAGQALGWFDSYELPEGFLRIEREHKPDAKMHRLYAKHLDIFRGLYTALSGSFKEISRLNNETNFKE